MKLLEFNNLKTVDCLRHGIVTRLGGCSNRSYTSMNLSFNSGDSSERVTRNRAMVAEEFKVTPDKLIFPDQCHTSNVSWVEGNSVRLSEVDALVTAERKTAVAVLSADCVPILFCDPKRKVVAAAHAGWRGTLSGVVSKVIAEITGKGECQAENILVGIGPSIKQHNYEVGEELAQKVEALPLKNLNNILLPSAKKGHWLLDLPNLNKQLLLLQGVPDSNIEMMPYCTFDHEDLFFSARRDGFYSGRFGAVIMLK